MKATFISVWDGGTEIRTSCIFDTTTKIVSEIELVDGDGLDLLDEQYIELPNGQKISTFFFEDGEEVVDGQLI